MSKNIKWQNIILVIAAKVTVVATICACGMYLEYRKAQQEVQQEAQQEAEENLRRNYVNSRSAYEQSRSEETQRRIQDNLRRLVSGEDDGQSANVPYEDSIPQDEVFYYNDGFDFRRRLDAFSDKERAEELRQYADATETEAAQRREEARADGIPKERADELNWMANELEQEAADYRREADNLERSAYLNNLRLDASV